MKKYSTIIIAVVMAFGVSLVAQSQPWSSKMRNLSSTLKSLMPLLASEKAFNDPKNEAALIKHATALSEMSHSLNSGDKNPMRQVPGDRDPSIALIAELFAQETGQAVSALKQGHKDFARYKLKSATSYCIACHTRHENGPRFISDLNTDQLSKGLTKLEKAELLVALREFSKAETMLQSVVADSSIAKNSPRDWEKAVRLALALSIRVNQNPQKALDFVASVDKNSATLPEFKNISTVWRQQLLEWKHENTSESAYDEGTRLVTSALKAQRKFGVHAADVPMLRATAVLHQALKENPSGAKTSKALYLLGIAYEKLNEFELWPLHELYYEACIKNSAHSSMAQKCFDRYESAVTFSYSGSGGVTIPPDVQAHIAELKKLAH